MRTLVVILALVVLAGCSSSKVASTRTEVEQCPARPPATEPVVEPPTPKTWRELLKSNSACLAELRKCKAGLNGWHEGWGGCTPKK